MPRRELMIAVVWGLMLGACIALALNAPSILTPGRSAETVAVRASAPGTPIPDEKPGTPSSASTIESTAPSPTPTSTNRPAEVLPAATATLIPLKAGSAEGEDLEDVLLLYDSTARSLQMTAEATRLGTATPLPPNWVTPIAVTATPTPANPATAQVMGELATAIALTTGEPLNAVTATPTPTRMILTSTPTPTLDKQATAEHIRAIVLPTGTPTPVPGNMQTVTPLPAFSVFTGTLTLLNPVSFDPPSYGPTDFEWRWTGPVPAGLGFEVRVWREGDPPAGAHDAVLDNQNGNIKSIGDNKYRLSINIRGAAGVQGRSGEYLWTVALVQISPKYEDLGQQALPTHLRLITAGGSSEGSSQSRKSGDKPTTR